MTKYDTMKYSKLNAFVDHLPDIQKKAIASHYPRGPVGSENSATNHTECRRHRRLFSFDSGDHETGILVTSLGIDKGSVGDG